MYLHFATLPSDARVAVLLTLACKGALEQSTDPGRAQTQNLKERYAWNSSGVKAGWSPPTSVTRTKEEVRSRRGELHVPLDDEDLDLGMVINVTQRWGYQQAVVVVLLRRR